MAYDDALFQLGMDLTRSSTAQKEDHGERAHVAHNTSAERSGARSAGSPLIIDLVGARRLDDAKHVERSLRRWIEVSGAAVSRIHLHSSTPHGGVSGVAELTDGHISFQSWPDESRAAIDVVTTGPIVPARAMMSLADVFDAREAVIRKDRETPARAIRPSADIERGHFPAMKTARPAKPARTRARARAA